MTEREFSFDAYDRLTPDLTGHERATVFFNFPPDLSEQAWARLRERTECDSRARFAEHRLGDYCTAEELAAEIAHIWRTECAGVPLGAVGPVEVEHRADPVDRQSRRHNTDADVDALKTIPSADYVPLLTGREIEHGFVQCPFHADGQERTPSLHVEPDSPDWHCHACHQGGGLFNFYAALQGRSVPTGRDFFDFAHQIAATILGTAQ